MKIRSFPIYLLCLLSPLLSFADNDDYKHFRIYGQGIVIGDADFETPGFPNQHLSYSFAEVRATYTYYNDSGSGIFCGVGYSMTDLDWKENPVFNETDYSYVNVFIGGFTRCVDGWLWRAEFQVGHDPDANDFSHYTLYRTALWGTFYYRRDLDIHVGCVAYTGLRTTKVFPIIGAIWRLHDHWAIHGVIPFDMGIYYILNNNLNVGVNVRFIWDRHRVGKNEPSPLSIFTYRQLGLEAIIKYCPSSHTILKVFAGSTGGGDLKVTNKRGRMSTHYKLESAFYGGVEAEVEF